MKILKIHTVEKGWCEIDYAMLHAVFQILVDFVEQEKPDQIVDWNSDPEHRYAWRELRSLYRWWKQTPPARKSPLDQKGLKRPPVRWQKIPGSKNFQLVDYDKKKFTAYDAARKKHWLLEKKWNDEDQRNLLRLVEVRQFLWT